MASSADYILPGHREPIGHWPEEQLMRAMEDLLFDKESGFLPPEVAEAVAQLGAELDARLSGEPRAAKISFGLGRALDRWFGAEDVTMPALRGEEGLGFDGSEMDPQPDFAATPAQARSVDAQPDPAPAETRPTLSLVWDQEPHAAATPEPDKGIEP